MLDKYGLNNKAANVFVQCFDFSEIKRLREKLGLKTKLVQLFAENDWQESPTDCDWLKSQKGLQALTEHVDGVGPWYAQMIDKDAKGGWSKSDFAKRLSAYPFTVHVYTFREEQIPNGLNSVSLLNLFERVGADGAFTDQVPPVRQWREQVKSD